MLVPVPLSDGQDLSLRCPQWELWIQGLPPFPLGIPFLRASNLICKLFISILLLSEKISCLCMTKRCPLFQLPFFCSEVLKWNGNILGFLVQQEPPQNEFHLEQNITLSHSPPLFGSVLFRTSDKQNIQLFTQLCWIPGYLFYQAAQLSVSPLAGSVR